MLADTGARFARAPLAARRIAARLARRPSSPGCLAALNCQERSTLARALASPAAANCRDSMPPRRRFAALAIGARRALAWRRSTPATSLAVAPPVAARIDTRGRATRRPRLARRPRRPRGRGRQARAAPARARGGPPSGRGPHWQSARRLAARSAVRAARLARRRLAPRRHGATLARGRAGRPRRPAAALACIAAPGSTRLARRPSRGRSGRLAPLATRIAPRSCLAARLAGARGIALALARRGLARRLTLAARR